MPQSIKKIKSVKRVRRLKGLVVKTLPDRAELVRPDHKTFDYALLIIRNGLVALAAVLFVLSFIFDDVHHTLKGIAYFSGAGGYLCECLLLTDCFKKKVPHKELFMVYCFGPIYILLGLDYIFK